MTSHQDVAGWSCDERQRAKGCRNGHGCHCREITTLRHNLEAQAKALSEADSRYNTAVGSRIVPQCCEGKDMSKAAPGELHLRIARTPVCPRCDEWNFDDWHLDRSCKCPGGPVVDIVARLKCHGCGIFFSVTKYHGGECHSSYRSRARAQQESTD